MSTVQGLGSVELDGVSKQFGGRMVLHHINLDVASGELVTLLGPSGCGKTTALRIIAGFEQPSTGVVRLGGKDVTRKSAASRGIGIVFQAYSLFPHLTALENCAYGLKVRRVARHERRRRAMELLDMVGLSEHADKYPHQLSGGQQQRVALVRAIAVEPKVLLLDEPLSALDAKVRVQLRDEIRRIQQERGTTTIMVTHDQEEALTMANRIAVMNGGHIEQLGTPDEVYRHPKTAFVAEFVGVVNRIPGTVVEGGVSAFGRRFSAPVGGRAVGDLVDLLIRPEDLSVRPDPQGEGTVTGIVLRGAVTSLDVRVEGMSVPLRVDLSSGSAHEALVGDNVTLIARPESPMVDDRREGGRR